MVQLKNILLASSLIILTACAAKFDALEYGRVVDIRHTVAIAQVEGVCADRTKAKIVADKIYKDAHWLMTYAQYLPNNEPGEQMAVAVFNTAAEFSKRYDSTEPVSKFYCDLKLKGLAVQVETIQKSHGGRPR